MQIWSNFVAWLLLYQSLEVVMSVPVNGDGNEIENLGIQDLDPRDSGLEEGKKVFIEGRNQLNEEAKKAQKRSVEGLNVENSIKKYDLSKRSSFNEGMMRHIVESNPKSVVRFRDKNTILVPDDNILEGKESTTMVYHELDFSKEHGSLQSKYEEDIIPISSCVEVPEKGSGSVGVGYQLTGSLEREYEGRIMFSYMRVAIENEFDFQLGTQKGFSGYHECNVQLGLAARVFCRLATAEVNASQRSLFYNTEKKELQKSNWKQLKAQKFLVDAIPIVYCRTGEKADLNCESTAIEYIEPSGTSNWTSFSI